MASETLAVLQKHLSAIEEALRQVVTPRPSPLYRMMEYHLGWTDEHGLPVPFAGGKRVRPSLCLLACEALGGDPQVALPAAAAVELVHNFSLIHDDIQDGSPERHHRAAVWWVWGPAQGINAGDAMHALARLALLDLTKKGVPWATTARALELLDLTALELCEGQYLDINFEERLDVSVEAYLRMARLKTGALIGCALELGALAATEDTGVTAAFGEAGRKLGVAFQIRDDILDLWAVGEGPGAPPPGDILSKKRTLPVVYAMEQGDLRLRRELGTLYQQRVLQPGDVAKVLGILDRVQARAFAQGKAEELCAQALGELAAAVPSSTDLGGLRDVAAFFVSRSA